jgi:prevent-host-death family protein
MLEVSIVEVKDRLADLLNRVAYGGERVVLRRRGKPVAVLVSMEDLHALQAIEDQAVRADAEVAASVHQEGQQ